MRALLRLTTLGDREFTLYLLDLFKMADRQRVGAITAQNRRMALAFLNLELERTASPNPSPHPHQARCPTGRRRSPLGRTARAAAATACT